jgi:hypothetical protein
MGLFFRKVAYPTYDAASETFQTKHNSTEQNFLQNLTVVNLVKRFPVIYGIQRFIIMLTRALYSTLPRAKRIQHPPSDR